MREYCRSLAEALFAERREDERLSLAFAGEDGDFVRLNRNRVRQAGRVRQWAAVLRLVRDRRQATLDLTLGGERARDAAALRAGLAQLRRICPCLPVDPHLSLPARPHHSDSSVPAQVPPTAEILEQLVAAAAGADLVGLLANGEVARGFASCDGQFNWFANRSFNLDWSCYCDGDRAVKGRYAGSRWDPAQLSARLGEQRRQLEIMAQPRRRVAPGHYPTYLAPAALNELFGLLAWDGFGLKSLRTEQSSLRRLWAGERRLHPALSLVENRELGLAPRFSTEGFALPPRVTLVRDGAGVEPLAGARSAAEFGAAVNAGAEAPESLEMAAGELALEQVPGLLRRGLYVQDLWYCNYADRNDCRMTGMTRFASFWVEDGEIVAPAEVMRFDDSLYRMLGEALVGLTAERELLLEEGSYGGRRLGGALLPGALIDDLRFPL